jgi:Amt family ammonium transporter
MDTLNAGDTAWMLTATALVLMMTIPGLALFYGGMVRKKNVLATLMQSFALCCVCSVLWMVLGYSLAFSEGSAFVGGLDKAFLRGVGVDSLSGTIPEALFLSFQGTFAIITPALITGAFAERMKFSAMLWFCGLWLIVVYAPVCHWVWGPGGFLAGDGVLDFAGGTVVHVNAGVAGLVAAIYLGKRQGYGRTHFAPHNLVLTVIGASMLWVGWYGFNAGSALAANGSAAMALAVTHIAAAAAGCSWMAVEWAVAKKPSVLGAVTGAVGGLVVITPAAGFVDPSGALIMGLIAGVVCWWGATKLKFLLKVDDSLDAFGVHGVGGLVGALLTGVFASEAIGGTAGSVAQLGKQAWGVGLTVVYAAALSFVLLKLIDLAIGVRVTADEEIQGLDLVLHGEAVP